MTFGLSPKRKDLYGMMMYHKNRLIKAYEKVGCQLKVKENPFYCLSSCMTLNDLSLMTIFHLTVISQCVVGFRSKGRSRGHRCYRV